MKNKIYIVASCILTLTTLLFASLWLREYFIADTNHDLLEKSYFIGGIVSGIFAFGAFGAALWSGLMQKKTNNLQRFETTLFNMLSLQQQIVNELNTVTTRNVRTKKFSPSDGISWEDSSTCKTIKGRDVFKFLFENTIFDNSDSIKHQTVRGFRGVIKSKGLECYCDFTTPTIFDHYFRHLYTIIKFINNSSFLTDDEKYEYTSMVRATLSRYELIWIYYNCLSDVGNEKFKPLVESYTILKNMREDLLSLSKETFDFLSSKNTTTSSLTDNGFTGLDYEYYLTKEKDDKSKYYIGAFYNKTELHKGVELVDRWNALFK